MEQLDGREKPDVTALLQVRCQTKEVLFLPQLLLACEAVSSRSRLTVTLLWTLLCP